jgi:hypothetical protein
MYLPRGESLSHRRPMPMLPVCRCSSAHAQGSKILRLRVDQTARDKCRSCKCNVHPYNLAASSTQEGMAECCFSQSECHAAIPASQTREMNRLPFIAEHAHLSDETNHADILLHSSILVTGRKGPAPQNAGASTWANA